MKKRSPVIRCKNLLMGGFLCAKKYAADAESAAY